MRIILLLKKINKHECETNPHTQNETILTPARFSADFVARKQFLQRFGRQIGATFVIQVRDVAHFNIPVLPSRMPELVPVLKNNLTASKSVTTFHLSGFEEQERSLSASDSFCTYFQQWRRVVPVNTYGYGFISSEVGSQFDDGDIAVPHASFVSAVEEYISFLYLHKKVTRFSRFLFSSEQNRHENFFLDKRNVLKAKRNVRKTKKIGFVVFFLISNITKRFRDTLPSASSCSCACPVFLGTHRTPRFSLFPIGRTDSAQLRTPLKNH